MFEYVRTVKGPVFQCKQDETGQIEENEVFFDPKTCKWRIAYLTYYDNPARSTYQDLVKLKR